ncbi:3-hydroxyacyl-[acyl-carrier-protein] dehydratase FabZ, partial [Pasteurella multocida]|nr:3-hydroxyacyl-[acyl-carrier-protein] dehydratase FabZ [Pasteurella multocida]
MTTETTTTKISEANEIMKWLQHRYPFLRVDGGGDYEEGKGGKAVKKISVNETWGTGRGPEQPRGPCVLRVVASAQVTGVLACKTY